MFSNHLKIKVRMRNLENKIALVTGGAAGIGKIMARLLLENKSKVIIWDISQQKIDEAVNELSSLGTVVGYRVDVSDRTQVENAAQMVKTEVGTVDVLINNAGIVVGKYFHEHSTSDILKSMEINAIAPMHITNLFLPDMMAQNQGHICNIASSAGIVANPKMSVYAASKWSVVGWSDSLRLEMKKLKKNVGVTTILPYYINTGMFDGVKSLIPILKPEPAARAIITAIRRNKKLITLPRYIYRLTRLAQGLFSVGGFDFIAGKLLGIYKTMNHFTGHQK